MEKSMSKVRKLYRKFKVSCIMSLCRILTLKTCHSPQWPMYNIMHLSSSMYHFPHLYWKLTSFKHIYNSCTFILTGFSKSLNITI